MHGLYAPSPVCSLQAILLALDRKDREREMVSVLLAELHPKVLVEEQISEGFTAIMLSCEASPTQQRKAHPYLCCHLMLWHIPAEAAGSTASCEGSFGPSSIARVRSWSAEVDSALFESIL